MYIVGYDMYGIFFNLYIYVIIQVYIPSRSEVLKEVE